MVHKQAFLATIIHEAGQLSSEACSTVSLQAQSKQQDESIKMNEVVARAPFEVDWNDKA